MNPRIRTGAAAVMALGLGCGLCGAALGGGGVLDEDDNHAYYFGSVKDTNGNAVVNAKVKMQTKTITLMTQSSTTGTYKLPVIGTQLQPGETTISCSKDGYREVDVFRRSGAGGDGTEPVEIDCTLQHE